MLTKSDIRTLNRARDVLKKAKDEYARNRKATPEDYMKADGYSFGLVNEAADSADNALFNLLNLLNAHRIQKMTDEQLHNLKPEEVEV